MTEKEINEVISELESFIFNEEIIKNLTISDCRKIISRTDRINSHLDEYIKKIYDTFDKKGW